jgi:hypothetical protein
MDYDPVYVTLNLPTPEKYCMLLEFCRQNDIPIEPVEQAKPEFPMKEKRKPTAAFKAFCGPENLNRQGLLTEEDAYMVLMRYATRFNLMLPHGRIVLNAALKDAFVTDMTHVSDKEMRAFIQRAF